MSVRSLSCNIAIIPQPAIAKKAIAISRQLKKYGGVFVLDGKKFHPHATLYMGEFPRKNLSRLKKILRVITASTKPFTLTSGSYHQDGKGYLVLRLRRTSRAQLFHEAVVTACNPLRQGLLRLKDIERFALFSSQQRCDLRRWGFKDAFTHYRPHLTLTKFPEPLPSIATHLLRVRFSFRVTRIGLFQSGEHGTCKKLLAQFPLGQ